MINENHIGRNSHKEEGEEWRDIEGYEGLYQVSTFSRVRGLERDIDASNGRTLRIQGSILSQKTRKGYKRINLCKKSEKETFLVHRLVASAFVPNPLNLPCVNHIDTDKSNNFYKNLEWCTNQENISHATMHGLMEKKLSKADKGNIIKLRKEGVYVKEIAKQYGVDRTSITRSYQNVNPTDAEKTATQGISGNT